MSRTPQQQADDFAAANAKSAVISGYALEQDPNKPSKGVVYRLMDGTRHRLGAAAVQLSTAPRWVFHGEPATIGQQDGGK